MVNAAFRHDNQKGVADDVGFKKPIKKAPLKF